MVTQPDHAQIAGYLAAHWGNEEFNAPGYYFKSDDSNRLKDEVVLAVSEHDNGWWEWEAAPDLNNIDGLPLNLTEVLTNLQASGSTCRVRKSSIFPQYAAPASRSSADSSGGRRRLKSGRPANSPDMKLSPVMRSRAASICSRPLKSCDIPSPQDLSRSFFSVLLPLPRWLDKTWNAVSGLYRFEYEAPALSRPQGFSARCEESSPKGALS